MWLAWATPPTNCLSAKDPVFVEEGTMAKYAIGAGPRLTNKAFDVVFNDRGVSSLKHQDDAFDTNYVRDGATLGDLVIRYRLAQGPWQEVTSSGIVQTPDIGTIRRVEEAASNKVVFTYRFSDHLEVVSSWHLAPDPVGGERLLWTLDCRNLTNKTLEIGDLALVLLFNDRYTWNKTKTYTKRVIRHNLISGHGSFFFWMRLNSVPPYLMMIPLEDTSFEYFDLARYDSRGRGFNAYVHSAVTGPEVRTKGGSWRQDHTHTILQAKGTANSSKQYRFQFSWANGYEGVRETLYQSHKFDIHVMPGMTVPQDLSATVALRTRNQIHALVPEYPAQTHIEYLGQKVRDTHLYKIRFSRLGENIIRINYNKGLGSRSAGSLHMVLEFFVTEPLETLIKKRAAFLMTKQQHRDPDKWYNGLVSDWDMKNKVLRSPDDRDGLRAYVVACDDPGLCKVPYVALKNVDYPAASEIEAIEYYLKHYVWGGLQCTTEETYPYAIYGIPNWHVNRNSKDPGRNGKNHLWRIYDYPHIILLYHSMYRIALQNPDAVHYLDKDGYLERAFGTAKAFFTVPLAIEKWSAHRTGTYNELIIVDLIKDLYKEGRTEQADWLRQEWEKKVEYFVNDNPNLFGSEFPFDSTGFESTHALAKYAKEALAESNSSLKVTQVALDKFICQQIQSNLACRGWIETAYYYLGSDYRAWAGGKYTLSYMSQMGGWSVLDYGLYMAEDPFDYICLGYASYLSSWALMNTGTPGSNYGYWYPGLENDGGAGGGFKPEPYGRSWLGKTHGRGSWYYGCEIDLGFSGALRTATTILANDPIFGRVAYGGDWVAVDKGVAVIPKDGLRRRFHVIEKSRRLHVLLDRDGFAKGRPITISDAMDRLSFELENRTGTEHTTILSIQGFKPGRYELSVDGRITTQKETSDAGDLSFAVIVAGDALCRCQIKPCMNK